MEFGTEVVVGIILGLITGAGGAWIICTIGPIAREHQSRQVGFDHLFNDLQRRTREADELLKTVERQCTADVKFQSAVQADLLQLREVLRESEPKTAKHNEQIDLLNREQEMMWGQVGEFMSAVGKLAAISEDEIARVLASSEIDFRSFRDGLRSSDVREVGRALQAVLYQMSSAVESRR